MGVLSYWLESLDYDYRILSHCSRFQSPRSTCKKCINSCPKNAIKLEGEKPIIDLKECIECGDCVASCPVQAIEGFLPQRHIVDHQFIMDDKNVPTIRELLVYYKKGVQTIVCEEQNISPKWKKAIDNVNNVLEKLGEDHFEISHERVNFNDYNTITRRELFFSWETDLKKIAKKMTPAKWRFNHESLDLSKHYLDYQFVDISIDTTKCTLCTACETLCKKDVLQIGEKGFSISAQHCSNCSLCQDICPENAITLKQVISRSTLVNHQIYSQTCSECHEPFSTLNEDQNICVSCKKKKDFLSIK